MGRHAAGSRFRAMVLAAFALSSFGPGCASTAPVAAPPPTSPCLSAQVAPPPAAVLSVTKSERDHLFMVVYRPGPNWVQGKHVTEQPLADHFRHLLTLYAEGTLKGAGPFTDDAGGAALIGAADLDTASAIVSKDPAVRSGVMVGEVHPFRPVDWAGQAAKPKNPRE